MSNVEILKNQASENEALRLENEKLRKELLFYSAKAFEAEMVAEVYHSLAKRIEDRSRMISQLW
ncbi:hypothetical protein N4T77_18990 [Clostridium sp. CX1]|uniref:hypothetical protein n=1 Tax=Clostridium sp. CX1 TaxID=2978346 RepID=UPI0021C12E68|nr:hypothetical protein [Clostridium sp. CX1]MCT8978680.1 hypothetical protein [Clostridium sp. CX1]